MKRGEIRTGEVLRTEFSGKGVVIDEGRKMMVKGVLPGQKIEYRVKKTGTEKGEGMLLQVLEKSPLETATPPCPHFGVCGGCSLQTLPYEEQLQLKQEQVLRLLSKVVPEGSYELLPILGSPKQWEYRNKMEFSFGDEYMNGPLALGLHKKGSFYDIVTTTGCQIVDEDFRKILKTTLDYMAEQGLPYYHKMRKEGVLRHLLVRKAQKTGAILVDLITTSELTGSLDGWVEALRALELTGDLVGILHTTNDTAGDTITDQGTELLWGQDYFTEELLGLTFRISPFSFFQTNSLGAEVLYSVARRMVGETKDKVIFDLYSGTGTIGQLLAPVAKKVIGVELIEEAVIAARENAKLNGLTNCEFLAGDVLKMLDVIEERPDFIVIDPPREGVNPKALKKIIDYGVDSMVYISCKPTSLANDLVALQEAGYKVKQVQMVDMFAATGHVESVVLLSKLPSA